MAEDLFDTELFIDEIRQHPEIWNVSCEDYKDKNKKVNAWIKVCKNVYAGFEEKTEEEKNSIGKKLMNRWKNIRDNLQRSEKKQSKSGQGATGRRKYVYAKQLSFLQEANKTVETTFSLDGEVKITEEADRNDPIRSKEEEEETPQEPIKKRRRQRVEGALINFMSSDASSKKHSHDEVNEDRSYFESLLPLIKNFTVDQKIEFRLEILNIIKKIRNSSQPTSIPLQLQPHPQSISQPFQFHITTQPPYQSHISSHSLHPSHSSNQCFYQPCTPCHTQTHVTTSAPSPLSEKSNFSPSTPNTDTSESLDLYSL